MLRVKTHEILSWFSISRYERLLDFTIDEILNDMELRFFLLFEGDDSEEKVNAENMNDSRFSFLEGLKKGHVRSSSAYLHNVEGGINNIEVASENKPKNITITQNGWPIIVRDFPSDSTEGIFTAGLACSPFTVGDLISYYGALRRQEYIIDRKNSLVEVQSTHFGMEINQVDFLGEGFGGEVIIKLNMADFSDDELITEFKELIKEWRMDSGIDEPDREANRVGLSTLKKLISYKVIPFIDLMIWEKAYSRKISNEMYARILFPLSDFDCDPISSYQIKDTIKPFVEKLISQDLFREVIFFIKKNEYLKNMRVSDVMKLSEKLVQ